MQSRYTDEEKQNIIKQYENGVKTVKEISKQYNIDVSTLYYWRSKSGKKPIANEMRKKPHTLLREKNAELVQEKKQLGEAMIKVDELLGDTVRRVEIQDDIIRSLRFDLQASQRLLDDYSEDRNKIKEYKSSIDDLNKVIEELQERCDKLDSQLQERSEQDLNNTSQLQELWKMKSTLTEAVANRNNQVAELEDDLKSQQDIWSAKHLVLKDKYHKLLEFLREE